MPNHDDDKVNNQSSNSIYWATKCLHNGWHFWLLFTPWIFTSFQARIKKMKKKLYEYNDIEVFLCIFFHFEYHKICFLLYQTNKQSCNRYFMMMIFLLLSTEEYSCHLHFSFHFCHHYHIERMNEWMICLFFWLHNLMFDMGSII